jgi:hypothetical protein
MPTSQGKSGYPGGAGCLTVVNGRRRRAGTADNGIDDESDADGVVSRLAGLALSSDWSLRRVDSGQTDRRVDYSLGGQLDYSLRAVSSVAIGRFRDRLISCACQFRDIYIRFENPRPCGRFVWNRKSFLENILFHLFMVLTENPPVSILQCLKDPGFFIGYNDLALHFDPS